MFADFLKEIFIKYNKKIYLDIKGKSYTYGNLDKLSNQVINFLLEKKIGPGNKIIISANKDIISFAAMFACLKIGCAYSFVDFEMPLERLNKITDRCNPNLIVSTKKKDLLKIKNKRKYFLDKNIIKKCKTKIKNFTLKDSLPAYIMFTSGSTGFPKGVIIERKSILNFVRTSRDKFLIKTNDVFTNVNALYFDNSVFDIYCSFFNGTKLVVFQESDVKNPKKLVKILLNKKCTSWFSTPSLLIYLLKLKLINKKNFYFIKRIIFGGEGFPKTQLLELTTLLKKKIFL